MAVKSLVLDIDGVILRDKGLIAHVRRNCERYVKAKLPACKEPERVNRLLYNTCGHTARGLQTLFGVDTSDFNKKVYDVPLRTRLWEVLSSTEFQKEAAEIHELTQNGWRVTLFTNSPIEWAGEVARAVSDQIYVVCPGENLMDSPLKPEATAYRDFAKHQTHIFVDDSLVNLNTARWLPNWHPVYFNEHKGYKPKWCPTIGSIWELSLFVNSADLQMDNHETYIL
jgi:FMN phosphatase YigB (HAD superfamily)